MRASAWTLCALTLVLPGCPGGGPGPDGGSPGGIDVSQCTLALSRASAVADGAESIEVLVTVRDGQGAPVRGAKVQVAVSGEGNAVSDASASDEVGVSKTFVQATRAGAKSVTASVEIDGVFVALPETVTATFVGGPAVAVAFVTQPSTTKAGVVMAPPVTLRLEDSNGNPATDDGTLRLSMRLVRSSGGTVAGATARAAVDGGFTFDALVINRPQVGYALRAEMSNGAAAESVLFDVTLGDLSSGTSTFLATPANSVVADGVATSTLTLTAKDTGGNVLAGQAVALTVSGSGNTLGATSGTTDSSGVFTTTLSSTVAEAKTVTATVGGASLLTSVNFIP